MRVFAFYSNVADAEMGLFATSKSRFPKKADWIKRKLEADPYFRFSDYMNCKPMDRDLEGFESLRLNDKYRFIFKVVEADTLKYSVSPTAYQKAISEGFKEGEYDVVVYIRDAIWNYHRYNELNGKNSTTLHAMFSDSVDFNTDGD